MLPPRDFRILLARASMRQGELAEVLDVWPSTVSAWMKGEGAPQYAVAFLEMKIARDELLARATV